MAFQHLRRPALPLHQHLAQALAREVVPQAQEQLHRGRRRPRAGVEHRDGDLAPRKRLVDHRQVADDDREEGEPQPRLGHGQDLGQGGARHGITQSQREERAAAEIEVVEEAGRGSVAQEHRSRPPLERAEREDDADRPEHQQHQEREGAEPAQGAVPEPARKPGRDAAPHRPRRPIEERSRPEPALYPPGQDDGLEGVAQDDQQRGQAQPADQCSHGASGVPGDALAASAFSR